MAKILEVTRVSPQDSQSLSSDFSLPLTFYDIFWLKTGPVERLFFYGLSDPNPGFFFHSVLPRLKRSLSLALRHFLPVAGHLTLPENSPVPVILFRGHGNDAVSLTVAESDADFDEISGDELREAASLYPLVPELISSEDGTPVMSLKVTHFAGKGFCVGITNHHAVLDGRSVTMFVKSWAHFSREDRPLPPDLTPIYDRSLIRDPNGLDTLYLKQWFEASGSDPRAELAKSLNQSPVSQRLPGLVRMTLTLTRDDIAKLRQKILLEIREDELRLSSFVVAFSYIVLLLVKALEENESLFLFGFAADFRSRIKPPVPENYFGNCTGLLFDGSDTRKVVADAGAAALTAVAKKVSDEMKRRLDREDVLDGAEEWLASTLSCMEKFAGGEAIRGTGIAGSPRFGLYGVDFGWGRPRKVDVASIDQSGSVSMAESRDGNGSIEIGVVLVKQEMEILTSLFREGLELRD